MKFRWMSVRFARVRNVKPRENNHLNQLNQLNQSFRWEGSSRQNRPIGLGCNQDGVRQGGLGRGPTLKAKLEVRDGLNQMLIVRFFLNPLENGPICRWF